MVFPHHWADYFQLGDGALMARPLKEMITFTREEKNAAT
jgi:hypothetical protein